MRKKQALQLEDMIRIGIITVLSAEVLGTDTGNECSRPWFHHGK